MDAHAQIPQTNPQLGRWDGTHGTTEFCPFIEAYSFTGLLAPKEEKKTTKPQIKKEHWRWEEATGTEAKQTMAGKGESKLQRGSLAEDAQRAD